MSIPRFASIQRSSSPRKRRKGQPRRSSRVLDEPYLAALRQMACWSCNVATYSRIAAYLAEGLQVMAPRGESEAAHIGLSTERRGVSQKVSDTSAIALCSWCHQYGDGSIHKGNPDAFFEARGATRDTVIRLFRAIYAQVEL